MKTAQKIVARGALAGVLLMMVSVTVLYELLPQVEGNIPAFIYGCMALSVVPLFIMIATVGNKRFMSGAINPLAHAENKAMEIDGRVVDNTLQQNFVFVVGLLALSVQLPFPQMKLLLALSITFVLARLAFWYGYRKDPLLRAPGMAATSYLNLFILITVLYAFLR
ncbi:MAG: MAPEG family protein [Patescibacteria group bacterium]